jgi:hypothetical protein
LYYPSWVRVNAFLTIKGVYSCLIHTRRHLKMPKKGYL